MSRTAVGSSKTEAVSGFDPKPYVREGVTA